MIKELKQALRFVLSIEFWRMAVLWTISLLTSYFQLLSKRLFSSQPQSYPRCHPPISESLRPVCVITGVSNLYFYHIFSPQARIIITYFLVIVFILFIFLGFIVSLLQATSGLGAAAAHALSREGFYVVLGTLLSPLLIYLFIPSFLPFNWVFLVIFVASDSGSRSHLTGIYMFVSSVGRSSHLLSKVYTRLT